MYVLDIWPPSRYVWPFAAVGFLGSFTTFSTSMVDTDQLVGHGHYAVAAFNIFGSQFAGLAATGLSLGIGRMALARRVRIATRRGRAAGTAGITGSYLLGLLVARTTDCRSRSSIGGAGFCGGYTTFSTFSYELVRLRSRGQARKAVLHGASSLWWACLQQRPGSPPGRSEKGRAQQSSI
ncbi:fluoride efflux transporter FluC [Streptomyces sp. NPDC101151]|uniref:fluoride efflux transporter FluC n=1 Tax=Streptomyces sp. NPDC101151 TaxID=3366115 RepID=UPI00380BC4A9